MLALATRLVLSLSLGAVPLAAQCELSTLAATTPVSNSEFGRSIASSDDYAAISAPLEAVSGAVYVYEHVAGTWSQVARLVPNDAASYTSNGLFGGSIALSGSTLIVGARNFGDPANPPGKAYVFERQGGAWIEIAQLTPTSTFAPRGFGAAVALDGARAVVGAPNAANGSGACYVFEASAGAWTQTAELRASDAGTPNDHFGETVVLAGARLVVGAPDDAPPQPFSSPAGSAYVFELQAASWVEMQVLRGTDPSAGQQFGAALALESTTLVVGAPWSEYVLFGTKIAAGRAFVFEFGATGFAQTDVLYAPDVTTDERFGSSVALRGAELLVGVPDDRAWSESAGSLLRFRRVGSRWILADKSSARQIANSDQLGTSVAFVGAECWAGAIRANAGVADCGAVLRFSHDGQPCAGDPCVREKLLPIPTQGIQFGRQIELESDHALVSTGPGAQVFEHDGARWLPRALLPVAAGMSLAFAQDGAQFRAVLGKPLFGTPFDGSVTVYTGKSAHWSLEATLVAPDPDLGLYTQSFGSAVDVDGTWLAIGSHADDEFGLENAGSVYMFELSGGTWNFHSKLHAADAQANNYFGLQVLLAGDELWVGSSSSGSIGAAYRFHLAGSTWSQAQKLVPPDSAEWFGSTFALDGDALAVGAPRTKAVSGGQPQIGAVYVYRRAGGSWGFEAKLSPLAGDPASHATFIGYNDFGIALELAGAALYVGASTQAGGDNGIVWCFRRAATGTWSHERRIKSWDGVGGGMFGAALALQGSRLLVGSPWDGSANFLAGSVYDYSLDASPCATLVARSQMIATDLGGTQDLVLRAPASSAGDLYWLLGSLSGTLPVTELYGVTLPLTHDAYLDLSVNQPGSMPLKPALGFLDADGRALAQVELGGLIYAPLKGLRAHHVFVAVDLATLTISHVSNPAPLQLR
jgi:hypothetical protein